MSRRILLTVVLAVALAGVAGAQTTTWQIDANHSSAQFSVKHMVISTVRGTFNKLSGSAQYDPANVAGALLEATLDTASIDTRVEGRDRDLRSPNFFDVEKFPTISFKSKKVEQAGAGRLKITGDLTMHGVTREVVLDVDGPTAPIKDAQGNQRMGASATTRINRKDFGLMWNRLIEGGGAVVGDDVSITLDIELVKRS